MPLSALDECVNAFWEGLRPEPRLSVSEWADQYRVLASVSSAEPGRWRTSRTPYLREIMDCLSSDSPTEEVIFMKGSQIGGTEAGNNWVGYAIDHAPGPMMVVMPTVELAKRNSKHRIASLIEECPRLKEKVKNPRSRDSGNTILAKEFPGGILIMTGANSAVGLRSIPVRYLFLDEADAYPGDVDGEGDPVALARARTRTFSRRKIFIVSTPTISGRSKIEAAYEESDQRRYYVPCPHCGGMQTLKWAQLKWPEGKPSEVAYICEHCEGLIEERHKTKMLEAGQWRAERPGVQGGRIAGFHINSLYSPVGWFSWREAAEFWVNARKRPDTLRGFVNTVLGETWKERGDAPEWQRLYERREAYPINKVPTGGLLLTAGADVQRDRIEAQIIAWGRDKQSWSIDYRVFPGDTATDAPWRELDRLLSEQWPHESGSMLPLRMLAVDSGYNTQQVYNWVRRHPPNHVMAIKGTDHAGLLLGQPTAVDVDPRGRKIRRGCKVWPVGTGMAKRELYSWLRLDRPTDDTPYPAGYCHFPQYGDEYFKQLTAEQLVTRTIRGRPRSEWEKTRDRNEALDTWIYARAAAAAIGLDRIPRERWDQIEAELGIQAARPTDPGGPQSPQPATSSLPRWAIVRRKGSFW